MRRNASFFVPAIAEYFPQNPKMKPLSLGDLMSLEEYSEQQKSFRSAVVEHKRNRSVQVGPNATIIFEDRMTVQFQLQEMLKLEKNCDSSAIEEELQTYNRLIPDGNNWKATLMVEFPDVEERRIALIQLSGIEDRVWIDAGENDRIWAIADEFPVRAPEEQTSELHYLRFELDDSFVDAVKSGCEFSIGIRHDFYNHSVTPIAGNVRESLLEDLD